MMKNKFKKLLGLFLFCLIEVLFTPAQAQVDDKGVTSSGKEVDCSTIDPNDAVVNEKGQIVTSPRLTRNGKLITTECGFVVTVNATAAPAFCPGGSGSVTYTATLPEDITGEGITYKWYVDDVKQASTTNTMTYIYSAAGEHTVHCDVTKSPQSGSGSTTTDVTVYTAPTPSITGDLAICSGSTGNLTATSGYSSYVWSNNVVSSSTNTATVNAAGSYSVTVTDAHGCTGNTSATVTMYNPSVTSVSITGTASICSGSSTTLTANAVVSSGATPQYQWYKDNVAIDGATSKTYSTGNLTAGATYKCVVTAKQGNCLSSSKEASQTVTIIQPTLTDVAVTPASTNICNGTTTSLSASATGNGELSYQWKSGSTSGSTVANVANYTTPALSNTTTYYCIVTNTYQGCTKSETVSSTVTVIKPSVGTLTLNDASICPNTTATLNLTTPGSYGDLQYQWSTGGIDISGATSSSFTTPSLTETKSYTVSVTATTSSPITCTTSGSKTATVTVSQPVYDTLSLCSCQLSTHTFPHGLTFTETEMNNHQPPIDTLTKTYAIGSCPNLGHYTVTLWNPDMSEASSTCENLHFFVNQRATEEIHNGSTLTGVKYNGYTYDVVEIAGQCWLKENLRTKFKPDGTTPIIPTRANSNAANTYYDYEGTQQLVSGCGSTMINFAEYEKRFGLMYNWFTAMDDNDPAYGLTNHQGICPDGWHIPDTTEWQYMANSIGIEGKWSDPVYEHAADQISTGEHGVRLVTGCEWQSSNIPTSPGDYSATDRNSTGFSARPSGCWNNAGTPGWYQLGNWAFFWSSTREQTGVVGGVAAYNFDLHPDWAGLSRDRNGNDQSIGRSVRCIRNKEDVIGINSITPGDGQASCSYQVAVDGQNGICWSTNSTPTIADNHHDVNTVAATYNYTMSGLQANTQYYARAYVYIDGYYVYSNIVPFKAFSLPEVTTGDASSSSAETATLRGNVTNDGGYANTVRGICWSTSENPTLENNVLTDVNQGVGEYSLEATNLSGDVTYHYRAYATNAKGTVYGEDKTFTANSCAGMTEVVDFEGHHYPIEQLGSYCWMLRSLRTAHTSNGTQLTTIKNKWNETAATHTNTPTVYQTATMKNNKRGYPYNDEYFTFGDGNWTVCGYFYNYTAAKQICPEGWHLPNGTEWADLKSYAIANDTICRDDVAKALSVNDATWDVSSGACHPGNNPVATNNSSKFSAYPCGCVVNGVNNSYQRSVNFWVENGDVGNWVYLNYNNSALLTGTNGNQHGMSVRCVRDH